MQSHFWESNIKESISLSSWHRVFVLFGMTYLLDNVLIWFGQIMYLSLLEVWEQMKLPSQAFQRCIACHWRHQFHRSICCIPWSWPDERNKEDKSFTHDHKTFLRESWSQHLFSKCKFSHNNYINFQLSFQCNLLLDCFCFTAHCYCLVVVI